MEYKIEYIWVYLRQGDCRRASLARDLARSRSRLTSASSWNYTFHFNNRRDTFAIEKWNILYHILLRFFSFLMFNWIDVIYLECYGHCSRSLINSVLYCLENFLWKFSTQFKFYRIVSNFGICFISKLFNFTFLRATLAEEGVVITQILTCQYCNK